MLRHDDREQRLAERVGLALQRAEVVLADVRVLRGERDEAALGQLGGEALDRRLVFSLLADDVLRPAFEAVLADDDGPLLAGLQVLGQQRMP